MPALFRVQISRAIIKLADERANEEQKLEQQRAQTRHEIAVDNQREAALQEYINRMSELLLQQGLRDSSEDDEVVRRIAHVRTLTVLRNLDPARKASVLVLLKETGLINKENGGIVPLEGADFSRANLGIASLGNNLAKEDLGWKWMREHGFSPDLEKALLRSVNLRNAQLRGINLNEADLSEAYLSGANLVGAYLAAADLHEARLRHTHLRDADLTNAKLQGAYLYHAFLENAKLDGANLCGVDLEGANLQGADLSGANLKNAKNITIEELEKQASSLKGATMPDGSVHL